MTHAVPPASRGTAFVHYIIEKCKTDTGLAAALKRADNPATEYQSWEILARFGIDLEKTYQRLPFTTIAAAVARAKLDANGTARLGAALASCYEDAEKNDQAKARLLRLLACDNVQECCRVLRSLLSLLDSKAKVRLDYAHLLDDLLLFNLRPTDIKARWAQQFYHRQTEKTPTEAS
jgi:CRISPR system Cascade subunit CasB